MSKILDMRTKRGEIWDKAKAFLDAHSDENGLMNAEDTNEYERMEQEVVDIGHAIDRAERAAELEREMSASVSPDLASRPEQRKDTKIGTASDAYRDAFWKQMRDQERRSMNRPSRLFRKQNNTIAQAGQLTLFGLRFLHAKDGERYGIGSAQAQRSSSGTRLV